LELVNKVDELINSGGDPNRAAIMPNLEPALDEFKKSKEEKKPDQKKKKK